MHAITFHINKLWLLLIVGLLCACQEVLVDERGDDLQEYDYYIDAEGNEGIVVEKYSDKIIVISLDEATLSWGPTEEEVFEGPDGKFYNTKRFSVAMQYALLEKGIQKFPAQAWCYAKNKNGQIGIGSWRLPSYYDWKNNIGSQYHLDRINQALIQMGGTPLSAKDEYWTCTEDYEGAFVLSSAPNDYDPANRAISITPELKAYVRKDLWIKNNLYKVRAIKYVYYKN